MLFETDKCGMLTLVRKLTVEDFKLKDAPPVVSDAWHASFCVSQRATLINMDKYTQEELKVLLHNGYNDKIDPEIRLERRVDVPLKGVRKDKQDAKVREAKDRALAEFSDVSQQMSDLANRVARMNKHLEEHVLQTNRHLLYELSSLYRDINRWKHTGEDLAALEKEYSEALDKVRATGKKIRALKEKNLRELIDKTDKLTDEVREEIKKVIEKNGFIDNNLFPIG